MHKHFYLKVTRYICRGILLEYEEDNETGVKRSEDDGQNA